MWKGHTFIGQTFAHCDSMERLSFEPNGISWFWFDSISTVIKIDAETYLWNVQN